MKQILIAMLALSAASPLFAQTTCPNQTIFLVLPDAIRAYPRSASGDTLPCQNITGPLTTLQDGNSIAVSSHGFPRVTQFNAGLSNDVFAPSATGNVAPYRVEGAGDNDLLSIATDGTYDFVLIEKGGEPQVAVTNASNPKATFYVSNLSGNQAGGLAVDLAKNLLVAGYDINGNAVVDIYGTSASVTSPSLIGQITGANTGLLQQTQGDYAHNPISVAVNPTTGEIYVYTYSNSANTQQISVFPANSNGNVAPTRVIAGSSTVFGAPGIKNNKIAVSSDGHLFVAESNNMILVFAPGASGNVAPSQIIWDSTAPANVAYGQAGIAVRN